MQIPRSTHQPQLLGVGPDARRRMRHLHVDAPSKAKASFTALEKAGTPPTFGLSPTPFAPIG